MYEHLIAYMFVHHAHVWTCRKQKWELDPLEQLEVQMVESHHVSVGTKSNPYPLQEEKILLTSEPSFQLLIIFLTLSFTWWWLTEFIVWFDGLDNSWGYMITWYLSQVSIFIKFQSFSRETVFSSFEETISIYVNIDCIL